MPVCSAIIVLRILLAQPCASAPAAAVPPAYQAVMARHAVDAEQLKALGYAIAGDRCFTLDAKGRLGEPILSPEELEAALSSRETAAAAPAAPAGPDRRLALPKLSIALDQPPPSLDALFDGARPGSAGAAAVPAQPEVQPAPKPPMPEPGFDPSWSRVAKDLRDPKRRARGLAALSKRFTKDEDSETGLSPDAPEALRLLTSTLHEGQGGADAAALLRRQLALVASLKPEQKTSFAGSLRSPLTVYVALSRSQAPHALDAQLYFRRLESLLGAEGRGLGEFIREKDSSGRYAADFLLRSHAYDALIPYLNRNPGEAAAIAPLLFPDGRPGDIRGHASQLEGLLTQLAAQGRKSGALDAYVRALEGRAAGVSEATARRIAVYLKVNEQILPRKYRSGIDALEALLPPGLLEDSGLLPPDPYDAWPADQWRFVLQFASTDSYKGWLARFLARGYAIDSTTDGITVSKTFGSLEIRLTARLYPGDKEGFMHGSVERRFLADLSRDLHDPAVQGVILRSHAQFGILSLVDKKVSPGKLILAGSCRSAWDLQTLRRRCPSCYFIVNTGTGQGRVNNEAVVAIIEGLARHEAWDEIGADWSLADPKASARIQGPWTPPYGEALRALATAEKAAAKAGVSR